MSLPTRWLSYQMPGDRSVLVIERCAALKLNNNLFHMRIGLVIGETQLKSIQDSREPSSDDKQLLPLSSPLPKQQQRYIIWFALQTVYISIQCQGVALQHKTSLTLDIDYFFGCFFSMMCLRPYGPQQLRSFLSTLRHTLPVVIDHLQLYPVNVFFVCFGLSAHQVSKASADLMSYCEEHARNDPLLMGIPTSENPFKDKKTCIILQRSSEVAPPLFSTKQTMSSSLKRFTFGLFGNHC